MSASPGLQRRRARRSGLARVRQRLRVRSLLAVAAEREERGDGAGCADALERAVRIDPDHPEALHALARQRHLQGADAEAAVLMTRLVRLRPRDAGLHNDLGNLRLAVGDSAGALSAYRRSLDLAPDAVDTLLNMAIALVRAARPEQALTMLERACSTADDDASVWAELGKVRLQLHDTAAAAHAFGKALELDERSAEACCGLASVAITRGVPDEAERWLREALSREPGHAAAWFQLARSRRQTPFEREAVARVEQALAAAHEPELVSSLRFALARMHDELAQHDRAFEHLRAANRLVHDRCRFDRAAYADTVTRIIEAFPPGFARQHQTLGEPSVTPVFIAGAPRSGTTLVEQILASHPHCAGLGEVARLDASIGTCARDIHELARCAEPARWRAVAREYLAYIRSREPHAARITDKTPSLVFQLGLVAVLFPRAALVHCVRDPLDVGLSLYFQRFAHGTLPWAYDLADIGTALRGVRRLMEHWRRVFPGRIHVVSYESLVSDQQAVSRRLIEHCGLDWDERCLHFHATKREVHTASAWQVREPLYGTSVGRAVAYRPHLDELVAGLEGR